MLFSVNYQSKHKAEADEIRCGEYKLGYLFNFIKDHPEKRILITTTDTLDTDRRKQQIDMVKTIVEDYTVECSSVKDLLEFLKEGYHAFLSFPVVDWETFNQLAGIGVSDIYIDGQLGFQHDLLAKAKDNIKIRVSPTLSPNSSLRGAAVNSFYIRPEDLHLYSALDVVDFRETNQEREDALFSIYKRGYFSHEINNLLREFPYAVNNAMINKDFGKTRLNCKQKCQIPGHICHYCEHCFNTLKMIEEYSKKK